jgi:hypothetical protein
LPEVFFGSEKLAMGVEGTDFLILEPARIRPIHIGLLKAAHEIFVTEFLNHLVIPK